MKTNLIFVSTVLACVVILFSTCTKDVGKPMEASTTTGGNPTPSAPDTCKTNIKFATQIQPILNTYCAINNPQCHASSNSWGNFTTHAGFLPKSSTAITRIKGNTMPPDYSTGPKVLTSCEISKLESWIAAGAPNN